MTRMETLYPTFTRRFSAHGRLHTMSRWLPLAALAVLIAAAPAPAASLTGHYVEARCLKADHDRVCGNESEFYPPLAKNVRVSAAAVVEHSFTGKGMDTTWKDNGRRGAYVGSFEIK